MLNPSSNLSFNFAELTTESIAVYEDGKIRDCNQNFLECFGYSDKEEVVGLSLFHFFPKIYREILDLGNENSKRLEAMGVRNDSSTFPAVVLARNLRNGDQNIASLVVRDETERVNLENELLRTTVFQRAILNSSSFAIITTDFSGKIKTFNKGAEKTFGFAAKALVEKKLISSLFSKNDIKKHAEKLSTELNKSIPADFNAFVGRLQKQAIDEQEWIGIRKDKSQVILLVNVTTLKDNLEEVNGYLFTCMDITGKKAAEKKLKESARNLQKINNELDQFAYIVSHDLKAPLRAISNLSMWIEEDAMDVLDDDSKQNLILMRERVGRMQNLIDGVLSYSRIGRIKTSREEINVNSLLRDITNSIAIPDGFHVRFPDSIPVVHFNKTWLEQVFTNLISNAIKYHDKKEGNVWIGYNASKNEHIFSVADDGPGIKPEYHEKIFMIFQTLESKDKVDSTGIGLTIVKKIVEEHGGNIEVKSDGKSGTEFTFTIPKKTPENRDEI